MSARSTSGSRAVFTLGRLPDDATGRRRADDLADRLDAFLGGSSMAYGEAGRGLGEHPNRLRYAAPTGTDLIRWDGARQPIVWTVPPPEVDPRTARLELASRYVHVFGPSTAVAFAGWAGITPSSGRSAFDAIADTLAPVRTPVGDAWILSRDEPTFLAPAGPTAAARLLPSGDVYFLLQGADRELPAPKADRRRALWTPRVWPGGVLVGGELAGTWRRADAIVTIQPWRSPSRAERDAVEVRWDDERGEAPPGDRKAHPRSSATGGDELGQESARRRGPASMAPAATGVSAPPPPCVQPRNRSSER
jgi:hypothetical protein